MEKIDRDLRMSHEVLRHQIVVREFRSAEEIKEEKKKTQEKIIKETEAKEVKEVKEKISKERSSVKVNLKDLDEKLDKILETDDLL